MDRCIIIHYGEISLKGKNQPQFRKQLLKNITLSLNSIGIKWPIQHFRGYLSLKVPVEEVGNIPLVKRKLSSVIGISWFAEAERYEYNGLNGKSIANILKLLHKEICSMAEQVYEPGRTFRVEVRRSDKRFPARSVDLEKEFGTSIIDKTRWKAVKLKNPDKIFNVEIQPDEVFLYTDTIRGSSGLPVNTAQKVLAMLSGGIDSPVAAYLAARRGCHIDFLHFTASHMNKNQIRENKIGHLVCKLSEYTLKSTLYVLPSTYFDLAIFGKNIDYELVLFRRFMARVAEKLSEGLKIHALITGDNLAQVASQTLPNIASTMRAVEIPVLQPLLTYEKEEIIRVAERIGTFDLSIQPYKDCCSIFQRHPRTISEHNILMEIESEIFDDYDKIIEQTIADVFWIEYRHGRSRGR
jgi:thiamine biosynthesis protein ThiI